MKEETTKAGRLYGVCSAGECIVTDAETGFVLATIDGTKQEAFIAPGSLVYVSDDAAVVTEVFKLAPCRGVVAMMLLRAAGGWLPAGYTELEYIEANGTQYINTGINPPCVATISFAWLSGAHQWCYWGVEQAYANNRGSRWGVVRYNDYDVVFAYAVAYFDKNPLVSGQKNELIHGLYDRSFSFTFNGVTISHGIVSSDNLNPTNSYRLFGGGTESVRLYSATMTDTDGKIVLDLIPALRNADGVAGMWDRVSKQFFDNDGTGRFGYRIKGAPATFSLRDPHRVAPSGVYARLIAENELEVLADTEETTGEGWEWFANTAEAYESFGIKQDELLTE